MLNPDRYFSAIPAVREIARELYRRWRRCRSSARTGTSIRRLLALDEPFPDPATLIVIPDHYIVRMLYSQGVAMERLGIPRTDGSPVETDPRRIWQLFGDHFHLFRGTPSGAWLTHEFEDVFGITEPLNGAIGDADLRPDRERACASPSSGRARCSIGSTSRCCARPMPRPIRSNITQQIRAVGLEGRRASDVPARPRDQHPASTVGANGDRPAGSGRRRKRLTTYASYIRALEAAARVLQSDGRHGHRPRRRNAVHGRALRRRMPRRIFERALGGPGDRRGRCARSPGTC